MRIAIVNTDYPKFLRHLYESEPGLANASYDEQLRARSESLFGTADFYSRHFTRLGHPSIDIYANNAKMQAAWARENGFRTLAGQLAEATPSASLAVLRRNLGSFRKVLRPLARIAGLSSNIGRPQSEVLLEQIKQFKPDIIFSQDVYSIPPETMQALRKATGARITGFVGKFVTAQEIAGYDLIVALLPSVARQAAGLGIRVVESPLAFEPSIISRLGAPEKDIDVSFVGSLSEEHRERIELLEHIASRFDLQFFGSGVEFLRAQSPLRKCWRGEVWGREMFRTLARSKITLNSHLDGLGDEVGNMRLYEATGVGTFLLTDWRKSLPKLFDPERHLATWRTPEDCASVARHYLEAEEERESIARAGQAHTLATHTYGQRAQALLDAFAKL